MARSRSRNKAPMYATAAVLVALAIGLTTVVLVGSSQRRDDRAAYLRYERALLPSLKEGGRIVIQQIRPSLPELSEGKLSRQTAIERASGWRGAFTQIQADVNALEPPSFLGDVERMWVAALATYLEIPDVFQAAASAAGSQRTTLLERAVDAGRRADYIFDRAASVMQAHRRRLGLGASRDLPDPTPAP